MTPRRSKLDWLKSLRGADLTAAEAYVLVLLVSYSGASMGNAYPGVARLVEDSGLSTRQVQYILKSLVAKKTIAVTQEGGNKTFKGAATVYQILTPPQRDKGATHCTLQDDELGDKGAKSGSKGATTRQSRVQPIAPHQVIHQVINHHNSDSNESGAPSQMRAHPDPDVDLESVLEELDAELGMTAGETAMAEAILQRGSHPNVVRNKINKDRLGQFSGTFKSVNEDQKQERLKEEAKCRTCGVGKSKHDRWMAEGWDDPHPFVRRTKRRTA